MNHTLTKWLTAMAAVACLAQAAPAQTVQYDWTKSTEYRSSVDPFKLTPAQRANLEATIREQTGSLEPIFIQERTDLVPILTPEQLTIYNQLFAPRYYYTYGLMTPEQWVSHRQNVATRLNLTPSQRDRYMTVVTRSDNALTPITTRYVSRYSSVLTPEQWVAYRTGATSSLSSASSSSSSSSEEYRRVYRETTVQTSPGSSVTATPAAPAQRTTRAVKWRNQDLK